MTSLTTLVYRESRGTLVFAEPALAERVSAIHHALNASTWGEFKSRLPKGEFESLDLQDDFGDEEGGAEALPSDTDEFNADRVPGFSDGDYPVWIQTLQDRFLPGDIARRFGKLESSVLNGAFWQFDPEVEVEMVQALRSRGYEIVRRDDLMFW